ncbi:hypothetical protein EXU57_15460 [Segetibacter sp. 3557_3]|uniref:FG-GAP-like repeat-containing protein n=1 Tax=Segetibacter sp. 3557_3 TaxID=2547429 RepID=UPI001058A73A|nr:FG-GAP-like repeat-containing protein [Segetibacter sp. 3557_3]TDH24209.1 hypothetical protein EXU57_15460 [Segetibacter sp. 3557_3]
MKKYWLGLLLLCLMGQAKAQEDRGRLKNTVIIPASDFLEEIPKGNTITDAGPMGDWLFNNTGLVLKSATNLMTTISVPEDGAYTLFVRSKGEQGSSFKVAINDKVTDSTFGRTQLTWTNAGAFHLKKGQAYVKITRINPGSIFDVLVLTKNNQLKAEDITAYQLNPDVQLLKEYRIPMSNAVKFGDVDGDGKTDLFVLEPDFSAHVFNHDGKELWSWKAPEEYTRERSEFEAPGVLWDFDRDGKAEVVHWRFIDGKEWLVIADGATGKINKQTAWPTKPLPHVYNNFRLAIAKLTAGPPNELAVFTDMGGAININAFDENLKPMWVHTENRKKDNLGHYIYPIDLNKDGVDEVLVGSLLLDANGKQVWNRFDLLPDNHDHADSYKFGDVNGDGKTDIVTSNSEAGVFVYDAMTGKIIWQNVAEHSQQIQVGNFLKTAGAPQVVVGGRTYGNRQVNEPYLSSQLYWFDNTGKKLMKWPGNPINGNPDFVKGNWKGDGRQQLFWYKFRINDSGTGKLYFPDGVFHMFDFTGRGAEEVITLNRGLLRVYGSKSAKHTGKDLKKDPLYLKNSVVNHTHY